MRSAARTVSTVSLFTSPMILTASPGPGKGCRFTISSGKPNSLPTSLTSSLKRFLNGSINSKSMSSGNPPTLWWLFIRAASLVPDSITSGYKVPCTRKRASSIPAAASSNKRIKSSPIIFLFSSGSNTPFNCSKNLSAAWM